MDTQISARESYERGRTLRQAKKYDQALAYFQHASQAPNYSGRAHTQIALCFRAMERYEDAISALHEALDSSSLSQKESVHVLYFLGQTFESLGRYAEAVEAYNLVRLEDGAFLDVDARIKRLCNVPPRQGAGTQVSRYNNLFSRLVRQVSL